MQIQVFNKLPKEAQMILKKVFMEEQCFRHEYDETDEAAEHLVAYENGEPIGTCRIFRDDEKDVYMLGRLAVLAQYRGKQAGAFLMQEAEKRVCEQGGTVLWLHAQCRAAGFYEKQGYRKSGETGLDEGCPHIWMSKALGQRDVQIG